jgi:hypothetical protein
VVDSVSALKETVQGRSRGRLELLAFAVSPDGRWAATLFRVRETGYWLESLYEYGDTGWSEHTTSSAGLSYSSIGVDETGAPIGALRLYGEAPAGSKVAVVRWRSTLHEVPVQAGHFAFAAWDVTDEEADRLVQHDDEPEVVRFQ